MNLNTKSVSPRACAKAGMRRVTDSAVSAVGSPTNDQRGRAGRAVDESAASPSTFPYIILFAGDLSVH